MQDDENRIIAIELKGDFKCMYNIVGTYNRHEQTNLYIR